ncbi:hypothetical protein CsatA_024902 [Cannabis sativa]
MSNLRSAVRVDVLGGEALGFLGLQGLSSADGGRFGLRRPATAVVFERCLHHQSSDVKIEFF